jgi:hypothetical protein
MKPAEMPIAAAPGREIRLASGDDANRYMLGPHFEANPIGVEFDPDDVLKKIRSGTPGAAFQATQERPAGLADPGHSCALTFGRNRRPPAGSPSAHRDADQRRGVCEPWPSIADLQTRAPAVSGRFFLFPPDDQWLVTNTKIASRRKAHPIKHLQVLY